MKIELLLQIANILVTFTIGVIVALYLGKFNFKKKKREELINYFVSLNQSIYEYQNWHEQNACSLLLNEILKYIKYSFYAIEESTQLNIAERERELIFSFVFDILTKNGKHAHGLSDEFESNIKYFNYRGKNPFFQLELWLLQLNKKEQNKFHDISNKIKAEILSIRDNYNKINLFDVPKEFMPDLENLLEELKEIIHNYHRQFITGFETAEQILDLAVAYRRIIMTNNKNLFKRGDVIFNLVNEYKKIILEL